MARVDASLALGAATNPAPNPNSIKIVGEVESYIAGANSSDKTTKHEAMYQLFDIAGYVFGNHPFPGSKECASLIKDAQPRFIDLLSDSDREVGYFAGAILDYINGVYSKP